MENTLEAGDFLGSADAREAEPIEETSSGDTDSLPQSTCREEKMRIVCKRAHHKKDEPHLAFQSRK
jgi:hypothetical protein